MESIVGQVDARGQVVTFSNGIRAPYDTGMTRDWKTGAIVWPVIKGKCHKTMSSLYLGPAQIHKNRDGSKNSMLILESNVTNQYAGFLLTGTGAICGNHVMSTQIKDISVLLLQENDQPLNGAKFNKALQQRHTELVVQVHYLHMRAETSVEERLRAVYENLCSVDHKASLLQLRTMARDNNLVVTDLYGPGHSATVAGATVYITQCIPLEATIRNQSNCTQDLPIYIPTQNIF